MINYIQVIQTKSQEIQKLCMNLTQLLDTFLNFHPGLRVTMFTHCLRHVATVPRERAQLKKLISEKKKKN